MTEDMIASPQVELLPGVGRLGRQLEHTADRVLYEFELDPAAEPAVAELRPAGTPQADLELARWRESLALTHPHLLKLYGAGKFTMAGEPVIYLVSERADESLAGVLQERALSEQETREMLEPVLAALTYLHESGFAHTELTPANVRAAGDTLKLSSANLLRTDAGGDPAGDMRSVGVLLVQALTRNNPEMEEDSGPFIFREASEPFSGIVRHCLEPDSTKRWTAEQALAYLLPKPAVPPSPMRPPVSPPEQLAVNTHYAPRQAPVSMPAAGANRKWIYGGIAALLLIATAMGLNRNKSAAPQQQIEAPVATASPAHQEAVPPAPPLISPAAPIIRRARSDGWVVVVASYGARGAAEKRASEFTKRWPRFHAEVFQPPSQKTRNLVIIGKNLSQEKADALRKRAHQAGLPRDAYIKHFE